MKYVELYDRMHPLSQASFFSFIYKFKQKSGNIMNKKTNHKAAKAWKVVSWILLALLVTAEGLLLFQIYKLNMLPLKYFVPMIVVTLLIDIPIAIMMFPRTGRWQKPQGNGKRITAYVLAVLISAGCLFGWRMVAKGHQTINEITTAPTVAARVGVYVLATDKAEKIEDAASYPFAITGLLDRENTEAAIGGMETQLGGKLNVQEYKTLDEMAEALYSGKAKAMILNVAYAGIYNDNEKYSDFHDKTKLIYTYDVMKVEKPTEPTAAPTVHPDQPTEPTKGVTEQPFTVYLSGSDTRSTTLTNSVSRSDVNIIAVVNPATKQILLVNTPRDYYVKNPAYGFLDKLTHCGLDGMENSMEALSGLYGVDIDYNAQINFTGFEKLIDAIGGIDIYSEKGDGVHLSTGNTHMNGAQALEFARDRYSYADGDHARGRHQMQVITAVVEKLSSSKVITNYSQILDTLQGMFVTSIPGNTISELIKMQLADMASWDIHSYAVTGTGGTDQTLNGRAYVMYPDKTTVDRASKLMEKVISGEKVTDEDVAPAA